VWKYICISRYSVIHWSSALVSYGVMPHYLGCLWYYQCYRCDDTSLLHRKIEWSWYLLFFKSSDCMADIVQLFYYSSSWRFHISINCGESVATVTPWKIFSLLCCDCVIQSDCWYDALTVRHALLSTECPGVPVRTPPDKIHCLWRLLTSYSAHGIDWQTQYWHSWVSPYNYRYPYSHTPPNP
jgi:hypothetical protein